MATKPGGPKQPKPRTRTFTACLTCRSRKVKCDLGRPSCANCLRLKLDCAGYGAVLRWTPAWEPYRAGSSKDPQFDAATSSVNEGKRQSRTELFSEKERKRELSKLLSHLPTIPSADDISSLLDSLEERVSEQVESLAGESISQMDVGPFSVFPWYSNSSSASVPSFARTPDLTNVSLLPGEQQGDLATPFDELGYTVSAHDQGVYGDQDASTTICIHPHPIDQTMDPNVNIRQTENGGPPGQDLDAATASTSADQYGIPPMPDVSQGWADILAPAAAPNSAADHTRLYAYTPPTARLSNGSPYLPPDIRFLLFHYDSHVIDSLSCVPIPRGRAPWRHLHLPSALRAYGELDILGKSNLFRVSLLYSILSLTCYHLSSLYGPTRNNTLRANPAEVAVSVDLSNSEYWRGQAQKFRKISRTAFRKQLESNSRRRQKDNYEESLMAAMTLVCVGIVSGEPWDARLYILQCESMIQRHGIIKGETSGRAKQLYRILNFVKTIEESTFCHSRNEYAQLLENDDFLPSEISLVKRSSAEQTASVLWCTIPENTGAESAPSQDVPAPTSSRVTGVPGNLLGMITRTNNLIDRLSSRAIEDGCSRFHIPNNLLEEAADLETAICSPMNNGLLNGTRLLVDSVSDGPNMGSVGTVADDDDDDTGPDDGGDDDGDEERLPEGARQARKMLAENMRSAMYHALLVYFFREIRNTNPTILQHYISRVITCLESHQAIKTSYYPTRRIGTVVWPSFVVACEALSLDLRCRAIQCIRHAADAGFSNGEVAESVVRELWRRRDAGDTEVSWRDIVRQSKIFMILS